MNQTPTSQSPAYESTGDASPTRCPLKRLTRAVRRWRRERQIESYIRALEREFERAVIIEQEMIALAALGLVREGPNGHWYTTPEGLAYGLPDGSYPS